MQKRDRYTAQLSKDVRLDETEEALGSTSR